MASLVSSFIRSTVSRVVGPGKDLPNVAMGDKVAGDHGHWTLYDATMRDSGAPVTVFHFEASGPRKELLPLAQNAFKRFRTIRHPEVLRFIDGNMSDSNVYIVTDRVVACDLNADHRLVQLGLYKIATALHFLHKDCNVMHGNLQPRSIFVTQAGEWKLGGFELVTPSSDAYGPLFTHGHLLAQPYVPPEVQARGTKLNETSPFAHDRYQLGALIRAAVPPTMPGAGDLHRYMATFLAHEPAQRPDPVAFIQCAVFASSPLVSVCSAMENMAVMDERERNHLIERIAVAVDEFPVQFSKHKVLPILLNALEYGTVAPKTLSPIFKIAANLTDDEFKVLVNPSLIKLFSLTDRAIRLALLESLPLFVTRLDKKLVDKLFPHVAIGFADTTPVIREHTIKSMVLLAPRMSERLLNGDVLRHLGKAQTDPEPGIRTNATVCLAKIAPSLSSSMRSKVLIPGLTRALADAFPPARVAALNGLVACLEYFNAPDMAARLLPAVCPVLLDSEKPARALALQLVEAMLAVVRDAANAMPESAAPPAEAEAAVAVATAANAGSSSGMTGPSSPATGMATTSASNTSFGMPGRWGPASSVSSGNNAATPKPLGLTSASASAAQSTSTITSGAAAQSKSADDDGGDWGGWGDAFSQALPSTTASTTAGAGAWSGSSSSSPKLSAAAPFGAFGSTATNGTAAAAAAAKPAASIGAGFTWPTPPPAPSSSSSSTPAAATRSMTAPLGGTSSSGGFGAFAPPPSGPFSSTTAATTGGWGTDDAWGAFEIPAAKPAAAAAPAPMAGLGTFPSLVPTPAAAGAAAPAAKPSASASSGGWGDDFAWK
ncbi:Nuclear aminoacylation-dependent tRNA export pathway component [Blastocladiella emersonii ATCC 22665]|nr:Nuclear aminoacylation-dependent tRNA export pathway component [Blastocladiella emersonii ATCC 22665]